MAAAAKARELRVAGVQIADFSVGEPDFPTPDHICQAAREAIAAGKTHYTPAPGIPELRQAVAHWYVQHYGLECTSEQVLISNGAKHAIHTALTALLNPEDEVIIPAPYWVSYSDLVAMTGAHPVLIPTEPDSHYKLTAKQLRDALTTKTRLLMLNSPCNPTGTVYTRHELIALLEQLIDTDVLIMSDEIYEQLIFGNQQPTCVATLFPELRDRVVTISGASKSYAMTGWRMGWTVAPPHLIKAMNAIQSQQTGCPCSISQFATLAALTGPQDCVEQMRQEFQARRDLVCDRLASMPNLHFPRPEGAFYVFFSVSAYYGKTIGGRPVTDSVSFCQAVLEHAHVNLVPGLAFGDDRCARLSYACAREQLDSGLTHLHTLLSEVA